MSLIGIPGTGVEVYIMRGIIAGAEALLFMKGSKAATVGLIVALSGVVPSSGWAFGLANSAPRLDYNQNIVETALAALIGSAIITGIFDGHYFRNAAYIAIVSTSSRAIANGVLGSLIVV